MDIAIVGAGFAGLSAAKTLSSFGHDVAVFEKAPDVGGVWSRTRRYPGLSTQNDKGTYSLSDFPMPDHYPEWPSGEQVQSYLQSYAEHFGLMDKIYLNCEVTSVQPQPNGGWLVDAGARRQHFDHLVVANGIFCQPFIPPYPGVDEFNAAGGRLCHAREFTCGADADDKDVVVVGYGKSSCDVAAALSTITRSMTVVARELIWKMPRRLGGLVNYKYLMLTRLGESLFRYIEPVGFEKFLHGRGDAIRQAMLKFVELQTVRQLGLDDLGLRPWGSLERIARSTVSLVTEGFFEAVADGTIAVRRDSAITELCAVDGRPCARLDDGTLLPADLVLCGTGFQQQVPFLPTHVQSTLCDERGNFELFRQILPHSVKDLTFCGYNSSFFSPLSAEIAALWIAVHLDGSLKIPPPDQRRAQVSKRLRWMETRTEGKHARGTNIIPFSIHNVDEMLSDLGISLGRYRRLLEWLAPLRPGAYAKAVQKSLEQRQLTVLESVKQ